MNDKVRQHLIDYATTRGWKTDEETLCEIVTEGKLIHKQLGEEHRWYHEEYRVVEVNGMLIGYDWFNVTGDDSIRDMGLELDVKSICEVKATTKIVTDYVKV